jgi:hypothetical protein
VTRHHSCRVSPFGHPRIHARLTAPRGITQPPTSFIGSQCQGIHHAPLNTYNTKPKAIYNFEIAHQTPKSPHHPHGRHEHISLPRCSQPLSTNQTPHPTTKVEQQHAETPSRESTPPPVSHDRDEEIAGLLSQSPIVCLMISRRPTPSDENVPGAGMFVVHPNRTHYRHRSIHRIAAITEPPHNVGGPQSRGAP